MILKKQLLATPHIIDWVEEPIVKALLLFKFMCVIEDKLLRSSPTKICETLTTNYKIQMSTFKVYSSKDNNAKDLGRKNSMNFRFILILLPLIGLGMAMINKIFHYQLATVFWIVYVGLILVVIGYSLVLIGNLRPIGIISFHDNKIVKKLEDFSENWDYDSISGFIIKTHIRDMFFQKNKFGIRSYFLEVQFKDKKTQRLVISSVSSDNPAYGLRETLNTLLKTRKIEVKI